VQIIFSAVTAALGLLSCGPFFGVHSWKLEGPVTGFSAVARFVLRPWHLLLVWLLALVLIAGVKRAQSPASREHVRLVGHILSIVAIATLFGAFADVLYSEFLHPLLDLAILVASAALLLELTGWRVLHLIRDVLVSDTCRTIAKQSVDFVKKVVKGIRVIPSWLIQTLKVENVGTAILKTLIGIVILIALGEIPNTGKTIVLPFEALEPLGLQNADDKKDIGRLISERIVNTLGLLKQDFRSDIFILSPGKTSAQATLGEESTMLQASVKDSDIQIGGVKIPLSLLTLPIQSPVRKILGVRVIRGTIQKEGKYYVLFASSSTGETWRAQYLDADLAGAGTVSPDGKNMIAGNSATQVACSDPSADRDAQHDASPGDQIAKLADDVAYQVMATDPTLVKDGMISSWKAISPFRDGLKWWHEYETGDNYDALTKAERCFEEATRADQKFTLANYRLGRALSDDYRPAAAARVFRAALQANPRFIATYIALANVLIDFDSLMYPAFAAVSKPPSSSMAQSARNREAQSRYRDVLLSPADGGSLADRASAYTGLCKASRDQYYLAYFYCARAIQLYEQYSRSQPAASTVIDGEGNAFNELGITFDAVPPTNFFTQPGETWHCSSETVPEDAVTKEGKIGSRKLWSSPYSGVALRYYERAMSLLPADTVVRCNAAMARYAASGDTKAMEELKHEASAHERLGEDYSATAKEKSDKDEDDGAGYYRLALKEFQNAIERSPSDMVALNHYAYTFWEWRVHSPYAKPPLGPDPNMAHFAEQYARDASRLSMRNVSRTEQVEIQSTLGEVLLGEGRPYEAIEVLERFFNNGTRTDPPSNGRPAPTQGPVINADPPSVPQHPAFDEIRWDMAQAYMCAASNDRTAHVPAAKVDSLRAKASPLLEQIRQHERTSEAQAFTNDPARLDLARSQMACQWLRGPEGTLVEVEPGSPAYQLKGGKPEYGSHAPCAWLGVIADAVDQNGATAKENLMLHIWGGGVDRGIWVGGDNNREDIVLSSAPRATRSYYFAQLADKDGSPISVVYPLETFENEAPDTCSRNLLTLTFVTSNH
jgi:tetratricopeptide (TPR) repeat protein